MKLNSRERKALHVMISFFMKGSPYQRIAEHLFDKGFTKTQAYHFLYDTDKLGGPLGEDTKNWIYESFCQLLQGNSQDWSRTVGTRLQKAVNDAAKKANEQRTN